MIESAGASDLITYNADGFQVTTLPFIYEADVSGKGILLGHMARANPHWKLAKGSHGLVIVRGPSAYVSPSVYPSKKEHHKVVPTWNYVTVHLRGTVVVHEETTWIKEVVSRLTDRFEVVSEAPWKISDGPEDFIESQLKAVVGIEFCVQEIQAKYKLSQNRPEADFEAVRYDMLRRSELPMYEAMTHLKR